MMILSPVITLKGSPPPQSVKAREVLVGSLLIFAGLGILVLAKARKADWN